MTQYLFPILILSMLLAVTVEAEDNVVIKTYIVAGQSNANGFGLASGDLYSGELVPNQNLTDLGRSDLLANQNSAYIFKGGDSSAIGEWKNMAPGYGTWNGLRFGPELSFSKQFHSATGAQVAIIKYSPDGTSLYSDWNPNLAATNRYDYFIDTVNNAKTAAATRGWSLDISGVLWMQGESDTFGMDAPAAYEQNLSNFISKARNDLNLPNLAFHIGQIANSTAWPARQKIWDAQESVAALDSKAFLVNAKDLPLFTNDGLGLIKTHYTTEGTVMLGERFASSVASAEAFSPYPVSTSDAVTTEKNKPVTIDALANDTGQNLIIADVNNYSAKGGTIKVVAGKVIYTPKLGFIGEDSFWYVLSDYIGRTNSAKVTIEVINQSIDAYPQGNPDNATSVQEELITIDVLANDTGSGLKITATNPWSLRGGQVAIVNNKLTYISGRTFSGEDKIWYVLEDAQGRTNSAEVTIDVSINAPYPVAITEAISATKNTAKTVDVLANDIGVGVTINSVNEYTANGSTVAISNGKLVYTPKPNYTGNDSFWYSIKDYLGRLNAIKVTVNISN